MRSVFERNAQPLKVAAFATVVVLAAPAVARASGSDDATFGRIEGDAAIAAGVGAVVATGGLRAAADVHFRYLETVGVFATYEDAFGSTSGFRRVGSAGLELRPLFLYRWLRGSSADAGLVELTVDSVGIQVGSFLYQSTGGGVFPGLQAGLELEVPLFARAGGPWVALAGGARWSQAGLAMVPGAADPSLHREAFLAMTLSWHQIVTAHIVDLGDKAPR